jgi:hypothetical protein
MSLIGRPTDLKEVALDTTWTMGHRYPGIVLTN